MERLKRKWYRNNVDSEFDVDSVPIIEDVEEEVESAQPIPLVPRTSQTKSRAHTPPTNPTPLPEDMNILPLLSSMVSGGRTLINVSRLQFFRV
jgi:hypothetical protein